MNIKKLFFIMGMILFLISCQKDNSVDLVIQDIRFEQSYVLYVDNIRLDHLYFIVTYDNNETDKVYVEPSMLSDEDYQKLQTNGLHELTLMYEDVTKKIVVYVADIDPSIPFSYAYIEMPTGPIPANLFDMGQLNIRFEFNNGYQETYPFNELLIDQETLADTYDVGDHVFRFHLFEMDYQFSVTFTYPDIRYDDERNLYDGELPEDITKDVSILQNGFVGTYDLLTRVIMITDQGFIAFDGTSHQFIETTLVDQLKINDEIWTKVTVSSQNAKFYSSTEDIQLIARYLPYELPAKEYSLESYFVENVMKVRDLKYRFRGIFTFLDDQLIFTDGERDISNFIMDDETMDIILSSLEHIVDVNMYYARPGMPPMFILDDDDLDLQLLDETLSAYHHEFFLDLEIRYLIESMPDILALGENLLLVDQGRYGSDVTWNSQMPNVVNSQGIINPNLNAYTCGSLYFIIDNQSMTKGGYKDFCVTVGEKMTLQQADIVSFDTDHEVIVEGLVLLTVNGVSVIYDETSYALIKSEQTVGDVVEVHGFYEKYTSYLGGLSYPYLVRSSSTSFTKPVPIDDPEFDFQTISEASFGQTFIVDVEYLKDHPSVVFDALNPMGLPNLRSEATFQWMNSSLYLHVILSDQSSTYDFETISKIEFMFVGMNDLGELEGILIQAYE